MKGIPATADRAGVIMAPFATRFIWHERKRRAGTRHGWVAPYYGQPTRVRVL